MTGEAGVADARTSVEWRRIPPDGVSAPIVRSLPYLELKLEHPSLDPSGYGDRFFPDAVPYELDGASRVFYWRPAMASSIGTPVDWRLVCATPHDLVGFDSLPADGPPLVTDGQSSTTLVVDGTIAGDTTTACVASYSVPDVSIESRSAGRIELTVAGDEYSVLAGGRRRIGLPKRRVEPIDGEGASTVTPELVVRFPGWRELHHPAPEATYRLFPSFGLDIDGIPDPMAVPTTVDELDETALAAELGVDLSRRPYPERVLWQAFAYTAFGPHVDITPELTQLETGHLVVRTGNFRTE
ncbi:hypothetical protein HWV23_08080 [Natronomonas halophila]|uniref:hypothetical protein n=1 Tax=Natronomonas halophila TaxID=2747817 RepID=UPI0015B3DC19|nr:hypothetical protein [Natronomonas halophila]QLD85684.1 hypothetical protein HWV23_08080 [Natronomonas halophila]